MLTADAQYTHQKTLRQAWQAPPTSAPTPDKKVDHPVAPRDLGNAIALIRIPALGSTWEWAVLEGTDQETLTEGIGHQPGTAMPGQVGNFVLAGHRAGHGAPFAHLPDKLDIGDLVTVEDRSAIYTFRVTRTKYTTPHDAAVLKPVPEHPGATPTKAAITLITCTPRFGSTGRWIAIGELASTTPKTAVAAAPREQ